MEDVLRSGLIDGLYGQVARLKWKNLMTLLVPGNAMVEAVYRSAPMGDVDRRVYLDDNWRRRRSLYTVQHYHQFSSDSDVECTVKLELSKDTPEIIMPNPESAQRL